MSEQQQQSSKELKEKKKFESNWQRLLQLTQSETPEKPVKFPANDVASMFQEFSAERLEEAKKEFKNDLKVIMEAKLALDKKLREERSKLAKQEEEQYKVINGLLGKALSKLQGKQKENQELAAAGAGEFTEESDNDDNENGE